MDLEVGKWLRRHAPGICTILVMNKSESLDDGVPACLLQLLVKLMNWGLGILLLYLQRLALVWQNFMNLLGLCLRTTCSRS